MSVTNAPSVIIVGAIIAGLSGNSETIFKFKYFWFSYALAAINIFAIFVTQRMLAMYKKEG